MEEIKIRKGKRLKRKMDTCIEIRDTGGKKSGRSSKNIKESGKILGKRKLSEGAR
jgi:hypothetical protein